jgi:hypothetical protein
MRRIEWMVLGSLVLWGSTVGILDWVYAWLRS